MTNERIRLTPLTEADVSRRRRGKYLTLDKYGRLMLSAEVRDMFGVRGLPVTFALSYDVKTRTVGLVRQDVEKVPNTVTFKIDRKGYTNGRAIADKLALSPEDAPHRFEFIGKIDDGGVDWFAFRLASE